MVALDAREFFRRGILARVLLHDTFRQQTAAAAAVRTVHNHPFVAKENGPHAGYLVVGSELLRPGNRIVAVVPDQFDGTALVAGRELESDLRGGRIGQTLCRRGITGDLRLNGGWRIQVQRPERRVYHVAEPVTYGARAEGHPAAPIPGNPERRVRPERNRPDPHIIVEPFGHLIGLVELVQIAELAIHILEGVTAGMNGMHLADGARPDPLAEPANRAAGMPLIAKLGDHLVLAGGLHERADFLDRVGQWLFAINMLVMLHGRHRNNRVGVIGGADDHRVNLLVHLVEHHAKVFELRRLGILGELLGRVLLIHVAQGDYVVAQLGQLIHVAASLAADADAGDVEFFVGGQAFRPLHDAAGKQVERGHAGAGGAEELAAIDQVGFL